MENSRIMTRWIVVGGAILIQLCLGAIYYSRPACELPHSTSVPRRPRPSLVSDWQALPS